MSRADRCSKAPNAWWTPPLNSPSGDEALAVAKRSSALASSRRAQGGASLAFDVARSMAVLASGHGVPAATGSTPRIRSARPCDRGSDRGHAGPNDARLPPDRQHRRSHAAATRTVRAVRRVLCEDAPDEVSGFGEQLQPATHAMASSRAASPKAFTSPGVIQPKSMVA